MSHKLCSADLFCKHCFCPPAGDNPAHTGPAACERDYVPLNPLSDKVRTANSLSLISLSGQCPPYPLGLQLSLRSNADPSGTFCPNFVRTKRRENEPFSLTKNASFASIFLSLSSSIVLLNHSVSQKRTAQSSLSLPNQNATNKSSSNHKKADIFSLLSLHFFCALHFDLLFCKLDFFQSQQHVQSLTSNIFCYPAS